MRLVMVGCMFLLMRAKPSHLSTLMRAIHIPRRLLLICKLSMGALVSLSIGVLMEAKLGRHFLNLKYSRRQPDGSNILHLILLMLQYSISCCPTRAVSCVMIRVMGSGHR